MYGGWKQKPKCKVKYCSKVHYEPGFGNFDYCSPQCRGDQYLLASYVCMGEPKCKVKYHAAKFTMSLDLGTSIIVVHNAEVMIIFKIIRPNFRKI